MSIPQVIVSLRPLYYRDKFIVFLYCRLTVKDKPALVVLAPTCFFGAFGEDVELVALSLSDVFDSFEGVFTLFSVQVSVFLSVFSFFLIPRERG